MSTAKLGVMFIVAAMALAGVGAGYSAWFDTITVHGTVSTGDVDIDVEKVSSTWVYKVLEAPDTGCGLETVYHHGWGSTDPTPPAGIEGIDWWLIASAVAAIDAGDDADAITVTYDNLFPCIDFKVDYLFQYDGSIPAKIQVTDPMFTGDNADFFNTLIWTLPGQYPEMGFCYGEMWMSDADGNQLVNIVDLEGYQIHEGDYILLVITLHLAQNNDLMNMDASFTAEIEVVQWNEYPYDGGGCGDQPEIGKNADVMLTLDTSGSIHGYETSLKTAAKAFVIALLSPDNGQVGIVSFDDGAVLETTFSMDDIYLNGIIDGLIEPFMGMTNLEHGIQLSQNELATADRTPDSDPDPNAMYPDYMVIITDGNPTAGGDPADDATAAKAAGTRIFVLGIGISNPTLLTSIASPDDYYDVADWDDLEAVLLGLV